MVLPVDRRPLRPSPVLVRLVFLFRLVGWIGVVAMCMLPRAAAGGGVADASAPSGASPAGESRPAAMESTSLADAGSTSISSSGPITKDTLDRETPRRTMLGFLKEGREGDYKVAASYLDLRAIPESHRQREGLLLAEKLAYVLEHGRKIDVAKIPDVPQLDPAGKGPESFIADTLYVGEEPVPIALDRVRFNDGFDRWLIGRSTVAAIPALDTAYGPRPIGIPIPMSLTRPLILGNAPWQWIGIAIAIVLSYGLARALAAIFVLGASYFSRRAKRAADNAVIELARRPLRTVLGALLFRLLLEPLQLTTEVVAIGEHATYTLLVIGIAWLMQGVLSVATVWLDDEGSASGPDLMRGRQVRTQAMILRRVASVTILFVAAAFVLIQFEFVRSVGVSLLASAGVAGVVVGFAAQKSLAAIIGGIQFSFAQPVRVGDAIVIEGEFGEIEEIYLTYAVVRVWDKRRLVLPVTYFLEKPFQNWTRSGTDLLGTVTIRVDFGMPIDPVRTELKRLCDADKNWDKAVCSLQVTDSDGASATLRALMSAANASALWDLRCDVREGLLAFVRTYEGGKYLPRGRVAFESTA